MSEKIDIVVQGGIWPSTNTTLYYYKSLPFVDKVILSTWSGEKYLDTIDWPIVILNDYPECRGIGNMNCQITSSQAGLAECVSPYAFKVRTDWKIYDHYFTREYETMLQRMASAPQVHFAYKEGTAKPVFVSALTHAFPYHPQDHILGGRTEDMIEYFNLPHLESYCDVSTEQYGDHHQQADKGCDWGKDLRCPIWLGINYAAKFSKISKEHLDNYNIFCLDNAPKFNEAMQEWVRIRDTIWHPLRKPDIWWEKTLDHKYPCFWGEEEYYFEG